jgi:hypothetical protein
MNPSNPKKNAGNSDERGISPRSESRTDESFTPPHGDPERAHLAPETEQSDGSEVDEEGPGPAEGHTDNKAGG